MTDNGVATQEESNSVSDGIGGLFRSVADPHTTRKGVLTQGIARDLWPRPQRFVEAHREGPKQDQERGSQGKHRNDEEQAHAWR